MAMMQEATYGIFTRVVTHPPDFGVTDQLSEFLEEESSSSSSSSSVSTSSSSSSLSSTSSSSSSNFLCDCCGGNPVVLIVEGFKNDEGFQVCECAEAFNGAWSLPFFAQDVGNVLNCKFVLLSVFRCIYSEQFVNEDFCATPIWNWNVTFVEVGGNLYVEVSLEGHRTSIWAKVFPGITCDNIDVTFTFADFCPYPFAEGFRVPVDEFHCVAPYRPTVYPEPFEDVVIRLVCGEGEEQESSPSSPSTSSSISEQSPSSASSTSTSSQSSSSSSSESSTSTSSQSSSSSSSSQSSSSTSSSNPECLCCDPESPISDTVYIRFKFIVSTPATAECFDQCDEINEICSALTRVDQCRWEGQLTQEPTCYPVSTAAFYLECDGVSVDMILEWNLDGTHVGTFIKTVSGTNVIDCSACQLHQLFPQNATTPCDVQFGLVEVNFKPFATCCHLCPDQYELIIEGMGAGDGTGRCDENECAQLNGTYLMDFDSADAQPVAGCTSFPGGDWCLYKSPPLNLSCNLTDYGWCIIHLFIRVRDNCQTEIQVEIEADVDILVDCDNIIDHVVGAWYVVSDDDCREIDEVLSEQCGLQQWNCSLETGTIQIRLPGVGGRQAVTRLTPAGYPGRRYGA